MKPSEMAGMKLRHINRTELKYQENALANFHAKAAAIESIKIMAHVGEVYSVLQKSNFCNQIFAL